MEALAWPDAYSPSTQTALRFAWAAAAVRLGHASPSSSTPVGLDDLLVGVLLAHPGTSEPQVCFQHFGLVAGQVLDDRYPRLTADSLNRRLDELKTPEMPAISPEAQGVLSVADSRRSSSKDGRVHLSFLWQGLLAAQGELSTRLLTAFETRGRSLSEVESSTERWLDSGESEKYADWLRREFPNPRDPASVVNFKADTTVGASAASGDLLQISREVDAFAYLLAAKDTRPPLAIGLFGAWGSGKTFFMESVRERISALLADESVERQPQSRTPFWKRVIAIEFNAWHYAEGDLLASLIDHIFTELQRKSYGRPGDPATDENKGWLQELDRTRHELETKRAELVREQDALSSLRAEVAALESDRDVAVRTLEDRVAASSLEASRATVLAALDAVGASADIGDDLTVRDARRQLEEARREGLRVLGLIRWITGSRRRLVAALVALLALPVVAFVVEQVSSSDSLAVLSGGAVGVLEVLGACTLFVRRHMDRLDQARKKLDGEVEQIRAGFDDEIEKAEEELKAQRGEVSKKEDEVTELLEKHTEIEGQIATPAGIRIRRFLDERIGSGEYRERLGTPAVIRRDLKRLTSYIQLQNQQLAASDTHVTPEDHQLNRIVLYIDDLDRCPDDKAIQVLQAVHLLLAFELFIVVVAVDSKWLSHALENQFPTLAASSASDRAKPRDYLEKIFQVPFHVRPLGDDGRRNIMRGLLGDHLRLPGTAGGGSGDPVTTRRLGNSESAVLDHHIAPRQSPAALATRAFSLTPDELEFVESLAPLLGDTPRAVKRFVNLFQLLRVLLPDTTGTAGVRDTELAAFLLACANSSPDFTAALLERPPERLGDLSDPSAAPELPDAPPAVVSWLGSAERQPDWSSVERGQLKRLAEVVSRFSFG